MFETHNKLWMAIDVLASKHGLSSSGLAKRAGLDATSLNPSKRTSADGNPRWPSTESIAKILDATQTGLIDWATLIVEGADSHSLPLVSLGKPIWDVEKHVAFPDLGDLDAFAIRLSGNAHMPIYAHATLLVLSPQAPLEAGARALVRSHNHRQFLATIEGLSQAGARLTRMDQPDAQLTLPRAKLIALTRIVWASQ